MKPKRVFLLFIFVFASFAVRSEVQELLRQPYIHNIAVENDHNLYQNLQNAFVSITIGAGGKLNKKWKPDPGKCSNGNIVAHAEHVASFSVIEIEGRKLNVIAVNSLTGEVFDEFQILK